MATRRLVIFVGDDFAGQAPASGLVGPFAGYAGAQTDFKVWNNGAAAWQSYWPGNNGTTLFGPELLLRSNAPGFASGELLYLFKYQANNAVLCGWDNSKNDTGGSNAGTNYSSFDPELRQAAFTGLMTQLGTALATIPAAGDTAKIEAIVLSFGVLDALAPGGQRGFADALVNLLTRIRARVEEVLGLTPGTTASAPVRFIKIHQQRIGVPDVKGTSNWDVVRQSTELAADLIGAKVVSTDAVQLLSGSCFPDVTGTIEISGNLQKSVFWTPAVAAEPNNPNDLYLFLGDGRLEGDGVVGDPPAYLNGGLPTQIWNPLRSIGSRFETLTIDNCRPCNFGDMFGAEATFAEAAQQFNRRATYIVKACQANYLIPSGPVSPQLFPFYDELAGDWSTRSFFARAIHGWAADAVNALNRFSLSARLRGIVLSIGTWDAWAGRGDLVGTAARLLIASLQAWAKKKLLCSDDVPVVILLPDTRDGKGATAVEIGKARDGLMGLGVRYFDPSSLTRDDDENYTTSSWLLMGTELFAALNSQTFKPAIQPLFSPTRAYLVSGIRLRDVPSETNAQDVIDEAINTVKANFYRRLGKERIEAIKTVAFTRTPSTDEEYLRLLAQTTETKWTRLELMRTLPMSFMDGNVTDQQWQNEAAFRAATGAALASEQKQLRNEIDMAMDVLAGTSEITDEQRARVIVFEGEATSDDDDCGIRGGVL